MHIRNAEDTDLPALLELNQSALEGVAPLDGAGLTDLVALADRVLVMDADGECAGFVVTMAPGSAYASPNYRWFEQRYDSHCYVDRVVVSAGHRRRGVASALYDEVEKGTRVTLEVYVHPPNEVSLAFHAARGYEEVGRLPQDNGKTAAMLVRVAN
jgi:predicted GNAT superfamily acetyltransferase